MHENGKEVFYMMGANGAVLFSLLIYAALLYVAVRLIIWKLYLKGLGVTL